MEKFHLAGRNTVLELSIFLFKLKECIWKRLKDNVVFGHVSPTYGLTDYVGEMIVHTKYTFIDFFSVILGCRNAAKNVWFRTCLFVIKVQNEDLFMKVFL